MEKKLHFETLQIHAGRHRDHTCSRGVAIYPTAAYEFPTCDYAADLFNLKEFGNIYTRLQNPTSNGYEEKVAALEGGVGALAVSSGMSAQLVVITSLCKAGDNIVAAPLLYGGTFNQFKITFRKMGIDCRRAENDSVEAFERLIDANTKAIYVESMSNPACSVPDLDALAQLAHSYDIPFVVDNTFGACGYLCRPIDHGADIVVESATKWINGHGTAMGGVIVDAGTYNWKNGKFPELSGPSEGYHGLVLADAFGPMAFIVKCRVDALRDLGCSPSPFDSYLMQLGLQTLSLRTRHEVESTARLAEYFRSHPMVESVQWVGFEDHPSYANAQKYFRFGSSGVLSVVLKGNLQTTVRFVESLRLVLNMTMIGDSVSVVTHPASTTHKQLSEEEQRAAGVTPTLLRISAGLENVEDIIADFEQAFEKCLAGDNQ
ncbi:MAG: O-acetylhomoserine aminocarboxypropyltransferase/cysteine synthase [Tidjanibacter sp.]|nr:O-acetylhomoserine aminocarboxypropyltransferase/cysteine synthase [Tidjanibacter sp.]